MAVPRRRAFRCRFAGLDVRMRLKQARAPWHTEGVMQDADSLNLGGHDE